MSHPAWHSTVWQTYDYDLDVNGAYYGARKGCEPVHVQANPTTWQTLAANHTPNAVSGATISAFVYDLDGKQLSHVTQTDMSIAASSTANGHDNRLALVPARPPPIRLELTDAHGKLLSQNTYWRYGSASDMQALKTSPRPVSPCR